MTSHQNTEPLDNDQVLVKWRHIPNEWMMSFLFTPWLSDFDRKMCLQKRNVLLFMDSTPSHLKDETYSKVKVHFFPANTTSKLQPFDQGIIKCLKSYYRKQLLRKVINKADQYQEASEKAKGILLTLTINIS